MTGHCMLLCAIAAGIFLFPWRAAAEGSVSSFSEPCKPPTDPSARVGLRGYRRFHANDSLVGRPVPCTRDDKICFRHNLIFDPKQDRCDYTGHDIFNCEFQVNRTEFEHGSGRVVGSCSNDIDPCSGYRMAYDGVCYQQQIVHEVICGSEAKLSRHFFGNTECRGGPDTPISVQQPKEDGSCVIPNFRFPDVQRTIFFHNPFNAIRGGATDAPTNSPEKQIPSLECESDQAECFSKSKVWISGYKDCHTLLKQGPCPEDHVVAMDAQAALQGRAEATCVHVRGGCPTGHKRMDFDGQCHEDREIHLEAPGDIVLSEFGSYIVISEVFHRFIAYAPSLTRNQMCIMQLFVDIRPPLAPGPTRPLSPPCGSDDDGRCNLYEVANDPPKPED